MSAPMIARLLELRDAAGERRHALAALCLVDQPFGFTREDAERLTALADGASDYDNGTLAHYEWATSLARRIAALLPPEAP